MFQPLQGGCLCGAVRYRLSKAPFSIAYCHCRQCQMAHGAPAVPWASVPRADLSVAGDVGWYQSSAKAERGFCRICGSPLFFRFRAPSADIDLTLASLDDPSALQPTYHTWTAERIAWAVIGDNLPQDGDDGPDEPVPVLVDEPNS